MKDELIKQLAELVDVTKLGLIKSVEVLRQEAPILIQEVVNWELYRSYLTIGVWFFLLIVALLIIKNWKRIMTDTIWGAYDYPLFVFIWGYVCSIPVISFSVIVSRVFYIAQIQIAPRIFLINYLRDML